MGAYLGGGALEGVGEGRYVGACEVEGAEFHGGGLSPGLAFVGIDAGLRGLVAEGCGAEKIASEVAALHIDGGAGGACYLVVVGAENLHDVERWGCDLLLQMVEEVAAGVGLGVVPAEHVVASGGAAVVNAIEGVVAGSTTVVEEQIAHAAHHFIADNATIDGTLAHVVGISPLNPCVVAGIVVATYQHGGGLKVLSERLGVVVYELELPLLHAFFPVAAEGAVLGEECAGGIVDDGGRVAWGVKLGDIHKIYRVVGTVFPGGGPFALRQEEVRRAGVGLDLYV